MCKDLVSKVDVGLLGDEESDHVRSSLLSSQVEGSDPLQGFSIGTGSVLQQTAGHLQLILFSSYVQRSVAILDQTGTRGGQERE